MIVLNSFHRPSARIAAFIAVTCVCFGGCRQSPQVPALRDAFDRVSGTMAAQGGAVVSFSLIPLSDDPRGTASFHVNIPPRRPKESSDVERRPTPGFEMTVTNLGSLPIKVVPVYPNAALVISSGPYAGQNICYFDNKDSNEDRVAPIASMVEVRPGQRISAFLAMNNLNARIRGSFVTCRLVLNPSFEYQPEQPWLHSSASLKAKTDVSCVYSGEIRLRVP